jgi:DNA repair protein RadC
MSEKKYYSQKNKSLTVHDLPLTERPREKLRELGADKLSNPELLAIILRSGTKGESAILTAQRILSQFGSINKVAESSFNDLLEFKGLGPAKASQLHACFEIAKRIRIENLKENEIKLNTDSVTNPQLAVEMIRNKITSYSKEHFIIMSFDTRNRVLGIDNISIGTLTASMVHPRETFEAAIKRHAAQIIAAHNHPSGDCHPSEEDIKITKRLIEAGKIMGIEVIDHLIITPDNYYSFKEKEMI